MISHTTSQGHETARAAVYTAAHSGTHWTWNSIVLTSCEKSVHDMACLARLERQQGESRYFVSRARKDSDGEIARDVTQKFGLIYAGGVLGIECGLLPWTKGELLDAVMKSYIGARDLLPDSGVLLRRGRAAFKALRNRLPLIRRRNRAAFAYQNSDGFKERMKGKCRYLIK